MSDGHAGNVRQASALAEALGLIPERAVELAPGAVARLLAPRRWPGASAAFGAGFDQALHSPPALAIGCGRHAALATRLLRQRGSRVVQILDPRIDPGHWNIVVAPEHDGLRGGNVITLLGSLNPVDEGWLARARADFADLGYLPGPRTTLLVGGPSAHAALDVASAAPWIQRLCAQVRSEGGSLLVTTSRRTPPAVAQLLRDAAHDLPGIVWTGEADGRNPYPGLLAFADRIVCTPDSVNMLSEACATAAPVFVPAPDAAGGRPRAFVDALLQRGRVRPLTDAPAPFASQPLRETARVATEVARRLQLRG